MWSLVDTRMGTFTRRENELLERAVAQAGFDDFGDDEFRAGLQALLAALDENTLLNPIGNFAIRQMIVRDLTARLIAERGFRTHPQSERHPIERPLVIVGLPRTGTTALQEMLALDPQFQGLELWLTRAPKPRPDRDAWEGDPDYLECAASIDMIREHQPELHAIHKMEAWKADECWNLTAQSFAHSSWLAQTVLPGYRTWFESCDMLPVYRRHRRNLQLIGSRTPQTRWLLKDSTHLFALDAFLEVYPDACVVYTHREPVEAIPSVCSLCWAARHAINDGESREVYGRETLDLWHMAVERTLDVRAALGESGRERFHDVSFRDFKADPLRVVEGIYQGFGFELSSETRARMETFREESPPPLHRYTLEQWGLDEASINDRFARYRAIHEPG